MYLIEREVPSKIVVLEALNRRAKKTIEFQEMIERQIELSRIGFEGEKKVDRIWHEMALSENSTLIHSFQAFNEFGFSHQMDTLYVNQHFILVLEIKTVSGSSMYHEEKHQFIRKKRNGEVESFQSPIEQVKRHADFLERIALSLGILVPIEKAVVIVEPTTVILDFPKGVPIFHAAGLKTEMKKWLEKHENSRLSPQHYNLLAEHISNLHKPLIYKPKFEIPPIQTGALCSCGRVMNYEYGKFACQCGIKSKMPLYQGLHDYRVLFNEWITNREFRDFFNIDNEDLVNKILKRMNFYYEGATKSRRYLIPADILTRQKINVGNN